MVCAALDSRPRTRVRPPITGRAAFLSRDGSAVSYSIADSRFTGLPSSHAGSRSRPTISISVSLLPNPPALVTSHRRVPFSSNRRSGMPGSKLAHDLQRASPQGVQDRHGGVAAGGNEGIYRTVAQHAHGVARKHRRDLLRIPLPPVRAGAGAQRRACQPPSRAALRYRPRRSVRKTPPRPVRHRARPLAECSAQRGIRWQ